MVGATSQQCHENEHQWSVNNFWHCILDNPRAVRWHYSIILILAAFLGTNGWDNIAIISSKWMSKEHQQFLALHVGKGKDWSVTFGHNRTTSHLSRQKCMPQHCHWVQNLSVNGTSTERQRLLLKHLAQSMGCSPTYTLNQQIRFLCKQ